VTEDDARLVLLQTELNAVQSAIRGLDTVLFQIKGWCVTAALAIGGFAVAYRKPGLLIVGMGAVIGFFLVNCQFKMIQRTFIERNQALDSELKTTGIMQVLKGAGTIDIVGTAAPQWSDVGSSFRRRIIRNLPAFWFEARLPDTFSIYLFILVCLTVEAIILQ
jgi:hypothetical protein